MKRNTTQDCYELQVGIFCGLVSGGIIVYVCSFVCMFLKFRPRHSLSPYNFFIQKTLQKTTYHNTQQQSCFFE